MPISFAQMYQIPKDQNVTEVQLQLKSTERYDGQNISVGGVAAAVFAPPAFLSSLRAGSESGASNQAPRYQNIQHYIDVRTNKALLIMAANGRIKAPHRSHSGSMRMMYKVSGGYVSVSPFTWKSYGSVYMSYLSPANGFIPMSLYQIAEVSRGSHFVELEGQDGPFQLDYVTSQVAVIPVDSVCYDVIAAPWLIRTPNGTSKVLVSTTVTVASDSILVMTATFAAYPRCSITYSRGRRHVYGSSELSYQIKVDSESAFAAGDLSNDKLGVWYEHHALESQSEMYSPTPGSMLTFARVTPGTHQVDLVLVNSEPCEHETRAAVLEIGTVPEMY